MSSSKSKSMPNTTGIQSFTRSAAAKLATAGLGVIFMVACTQELPYKDKLKEKTYDKQVIDTEAEYLYMPSLDNTARTSREAMPYWMGEAKVVKFEFTEDNLQVFELDRDARFRENQANKKLILEIPVEHVQYRCKEDRYGECQNEEEENDEITWSKKSQFKAKFSEMKIVESSYLPIELNQLFGNECHTEKSSKVLDYEVTPTDINIKVERTFNVKLRCKTSAASISDVTETIQYHYSFARRDSLVSKNYKPAVYSDNDENTFGFFKTDVTQKDVDFTNVQAKEIRLLNRWNPERKEVVYYLSPEFKDPKHKLLRDSTILGMKRVNGGLKKAGAQFQIVLRDAPEGVHASQIRTSMVVLVEDPADSGPLGYGPSATDPDTGEILSARTVMFPGVYRTQIRRAYEKLFESQAASAVASTDDQPQSKKSTSDNKAKTLESQRNRLNNQPASASSKVTQQVLAAIKHELDSHGHQTEVTSDLKSRLDLMSESTYYPSEYMHIDPIIAQGVGKIVGETLLPWEELSDRQKQEIIDFTLPNLWMSTFIHEIGHNLGLRHNFAGSRDEGNFYSQEELAAMGITHKVPYSSIMDYGGSDLNELKIFGKYDVAALRYAYAGEVEVVVDGQTKLVKIEDNLDGLAERQIKASSADNVRPELGERRNWIAQNLKSYEYCTDEHVSVNANCNRFDEGVTRTDIISYLIERYEDNYKYFNKRSGKSEFSLYSDLWYVSYVRSLFTTLRLNFESYENIKETFDVAHDDPAWTDVEWLADLKVATVLSAEFFVDVIKTPDMTCIYESLSDPTQQQFHHFDTVKNSSGVLDPKSCFDLEAAKGFHIVGQFGKPFKSSKSQNNPNPYLDQIDTRGVAYDKILALEALVNRRIGFSTFDDNTGNYTDIPELKGLIEGTVAQVLFNRVQGDIKVTNQKGENLLIENKGYMLAPDFTIEKPLHPLVTRSLDLRVENVGHSGAAPVVNFIAGLETDLREQFVHIIKREQLSSQKHKASAEEFALAFDVDATPISSSFAPDMRERSIVWESNTHRYFAYPQNKMAFSLAKNLNILKATSELPKERLDQIYQARKAGTTPPADIPVEEFLVWITGIDTLDRIMNGAFAEPEYYEEILEILASDRRDAM